MIKTSIIIPTFNRKERLVCIIQALEKQDYDLSQIEVIIVSDGSTDGTHPYLQSLCSSLNIRTIIQANQGVAAARNNGVRQARGQYIIFLDDDVVPVPQLVSEHMRTHAEHGENVVVLGPMLTPEDHRMLPWVQWEQAMLYKQYDAMRSGRLLPTARQFFTGNTSLARDHLVEAGGFDTRFRRAEDVELAYRLAEHGIRFIFNPDAIGHHYAERSFLSWMAIPYTYGRCDVIFTHEKRQAWLLPTVWREFRTRHPLTRALAYLCLDRQWISRAVLALFQSFIHFFANLDHFFAERNRTKRGASHAADPGTSGWGSSTKMSGPAAWAAGTTSWACSSIFNLRYYQGMADELGGRAAFFAGVRQAAAGDIPIPITETEG